ncbi:MAG: hypothetical protein HQK52_22200 [Oligoflexia bacterium]|nr:hypothetical protein [Oligoflexia bacterium]
MTESELQIKQDIVLNYGEYFFNEKYLNELARVIDSVGPRELAERKNISLLLKFIKGRIEGAIFVGKDTVILEGLWSMIGKRMIDDIVKDKLK